MADVTDDVAENETQRRRDQEDREQLKKVRDGGRVFIRVGRVGVEETATTGAQHFDGFLRGDGAHGDGLFVGAGGSGHRIALGVEGWLAGIVEYRGLVLHDLQRRDFLVRVKILDRALANQKQRKDQRQRQQHPQRDASEVGPGIADAVRAVAREPSDQSYRDDDTGRG
ncbi:hypothetical protein D3C76_1197080 [compost metagenome]